METIALDFALRSLTIDFRYIANFNNLYIQLFTIYQ